MKKEKCLELKFNAEKIGHFAKYLTNEIHTGREMCDVARQVRKLWLLMVLVSMGFVGLAVVYDWNFWLKVIAVAIVTYSLIRILVWNRKVVQLGMINGTFSRVRQTFVEFGFKDQIEKVVEDMFNTEVGEAGKKKVLKRATKSKSNKK